MTKEELKEWKEEIKQERIEAQGEISQFVDGESLLFLIDKIFEQQDAIEELKTITKGYEAYKCGEGNKKIVIATKEFFNNGVLKDIRNDYISKDKIKAKIKELEENEKFEIEQYGFNYVENINLAINVLKELLEEKEGELNE